MHKMDPQTSEILRSFLIMGLVIMMIGLFAAAPASTKKGTSFPSAYAAAFTLGIFLTGVGIVLFTGIAFVIVHLNWR
jgi:hypothetical protein